MPTIDPYSAAAIPLQMFFNDTELGIGTGFIWRANNQNFLITNWHNFTGKNPFTGKHLSPTAAEPNAVRIWWNTKSKLGEKFAARHTIYDPSGVPIWLIHPTLGKGVDVIALPLEEKPDADMFPINELDQLPQMAWKIGMDAHVLGYPYGIGEGNGGFPIWKRASIASEPEMITDARKHFLLDSFAARDVGCPYYFASMERGTCRERQLVEWWRVYPLYWCLCWTDCR